LVRHFASGRFTNFEFEDREVAIERKFGVDDGIREVSWRVWHYYDDYREHALTDAHHGLSKAERRELARYTLFLRTELPVPTERPALFGFVHDLGCALLIVAGAVAPVMLLVGFDFAGAAVLAVGIAAYGVLQLLRAAPAAALSERRSLSPIWPFSDQESFDVALRDAGYLGRVSSANS
jgi:hypothetical protein